MASTKQNIHDIIHAASAACAGIDGGSAQAPDAGPAAIAPIRTGMIMAIASEHGVKISDAAAADLLQTFAANLASRQVTFSRKAMLGWLPGIDQANNDSKAAALTEAIGWAANSHFDQIAAKMKP